MEDYSSRGVEVREDVEALISRDFGADLPYVPMRPRLDYMPMLEKKE